MMLLDEHYLIHIKPLFETAGGGNRTPMSLRSRDFESRAYTDFATPAEVSA